MTPQNKNYVNKQNDKHMYFERKIDKICDNIYDTVNKELSTDFLLYMNKVRMNVV